MVQKTQLKDFLASALSFGGSGSARKWEQHLVTAFNQFLGGRDVFGGVDAYGEAYVLATAFERGSVRIHVYGGGMFTPDLIGSDKIRYAMIGNGLMVRHLVGEHGVVRAEIESGYQAALELFGADGFADMCDKPIPYFAADDPKLIDTQRGVAECVVLTPGEIRNPCKIEVPRFARLQSGSYHDLRVYDSYEDLFSGVHSAWIALVSSRDRDWSRFVEVAQPVFAAMRG